MKEVLFPGLVIGFCSLFIGAFITMVSFGLFPVLLLETNNIQIYRPLSDPLMSTFFLYPFITGFISAWVWNKSKFFFKSNPLINGLHFGFLYWVVIAIPGALLTYSLFQISLKIEIFWGFLLFINCLVSGVLFASLNK